MSAARRIVLATRSTNARTHARTHQAARKFALSKVRLHLKAKLNEVEEALLD